MRSILSMNRGATCALLASAWLCLCLVSLSAAAQQRMSDEELDAVTAGVAAAGDLEEILAFELVRRTRSGRTVTADGSLSALDSLGGLNPGGLTLTDNAQSHLQALVNINAVNSVVNLLLNLNISIDSSIGSINQLNVNGALPPSALPSATAPPVVVPPVP